MRNAILGVFLVAETVAMTGCGAVFDFQSLNDIEPKSEGFNAALSRAYAEFALSEANDMYDWPDAAHFGRKALAAAAGAKVAPEEPASWRLPDDKAGDITESYGRLTAMLAQGAGEKFPLTAARAQTGFDCWVEQQEENWQMADIARCRTGFYGALSRLEHRFAAERGKPMGGPAGVIPAAADDTTSFMTNTADGFTLLFEFDSAEIIETDGRTLADIAAAAGNDGVVNITLAGHADRAGPQAYNDRLSERRARAVRDALVERGIDGKRILVSSFGEKRPRIVTPDGVREIQNRRVEVTVGVSSGL